MRLFVTGAGGMLGINLCLQQMVKHEVIALTYDIPLRGAGFDSYSADITDITSVQKILQKTKPDAIIHCAAIANVDDCEKNPERARWVNSDAPGYLAEWCVRHSIPMIQISTDAVFDGVRGNYTESDIPNPLSVYAKTKLAAERNVAEAFPQAIISRVNFFGFSPDGKRSLAEFFLNQLRNGKMAHGFEDVFFCPLYAGHLTEILMLMLEKELKGLFHVVAPEPVSKFAFGKKIAEKFGFDANLITPISVDESGLIAPRSKNLTLNIDKLCIALGYKPEGIQEGIDALFQAELSGLPKKIEQMAK